MSRHNCAADEENSANQWGKKPCRIVAAPKSTRLATRLCLVLILTRNIRSGRHVQMTELLASALPNENALGSAVLHARLSHAHERSHVSHRRTRTTTPFAVSRRPFHRNGRWEESHNHLRSALATQLHSMGGKLTWLLFSRGTLLF